MYGKCLSIIVNEQNLKKCDSLYTNNSRCTKFSCSRNSFDEEEKDYYWQNECFTENYSVIIEELPLERKHRSSDVERQIIWKSAICGPQENAEYKIDKFGKKWGGIEKDKE